MKTLLSEKEKLEELVATALPMQQERREYKLVEVDSYVEEEPPAWHEAVLRERHQAWKEGKDPSQPLEAAFQELREELGF